MLTRTAAAVKFDLPSTPEQKACSMHLGEGLKTFWSLVEHLQHAADERQPIHQVEEIIFRELLVVGRWLLQAFLDLAPSWGMVQTQVTAQGWRGSTPEGRRPQIRGWRAGGSLAVASSTPATPPLLSPAKIRELNHT